MGRVGSGILWGGEELGIRNKELGRGWRCIKLGTELRSEMNPPATTDIVDICRYLSIFVDTCRYLSIFVDI